MISTLCATLFRWSFPYLHSHGLMSHIRVLPSGFVILCYMLSPYFTRDTLLLLYYMPDAQLFLRPQAVTLKAIIIFACSRAICPVSYYVLRPSGERTLLPFHVFLLLVY
jgi:hypothetical protein